MCTVDLVTLVLEMKGPLQPAVELVQFVQQIVQTMQLQSSAMVVLRLAIASCT